MAAGLGLIPGIGDIADSALTGGGASSGDVSSAVDVRFAPVNVAGLFGSPAQSANKFLVPTLVIGVGLLAFILLRR